MVSSIYEAVKDNAKQEVDRGTGDNAIISSPDRFIKHQEFEQNIIGCVMKTPTFYNFHHETGQKTCLKSCLDCGKFQDPSTNVGNEDEVAKSPLLWSVLLLIVVSVERSNAPSWLGS